MLLPVIVTFSIGLVVSTGFSSFNEDNFKFNEDFETVLQFSYVNFTWESKEQYTEAIRRRKYIPENVLPSGIKFHRSSLYIALPKFRSGVPVTLTTVQFDTNFSNNNLLVPYPNWNDNDDSSCKNLQSVLNMEIDTNGLMYVIDGVRINNNNVQCPCKIVLLDLNRRGKKIQSLVLSDELCLRDGGFLNDIVVDQTAGDFAYVTDASSIDPGIIVFSRYQNRAWKIRDQTMFGETRGSNFFVGADFFTQRIPVCGVALSPVSSQRTLYFSSLAGFDMFGITTNILKNEFLCRSSGWRDYVRTIGRKQSQTDGMMMDSSGNLFYSLISLYGVGRWNVFEPFQSSEVVYTNKSTFIWTDGFGMNQKGDLYIITNSAHRYFQVKYTLQFSLDVKFRIHRLHTGTRSYLYNDNVYD